MIVKAYVAAASAGQEAGDAAMTQGPCRTIVKAEIAPYKYPRAVAYRRGSCRKTRQTGKLQRFALREMAKDDA